MSESGYYYRLLTGFLNDPVYYQLDKHMTSQELAARRFRVFKKYMPQCMWPKREKACDVESVPRAYHIYKGKCIPCPRNTFTACSKDHAHIREIIGSSRDPFGRHISLCARALRIVVKSTGLPGWTLWNQSLLVQEIRRRAKQLCYIHGKERICARCNCAKLPLEAIGADAAQFFKASSTSHAAPRATFFINFLLKKHPNAVVAVARSQRTHGCIATSRKHVPANYVAVEMSDILAAIAFARRDRRFC